MYCVDGEETGCLLRLNRNHIWLPLHKRVLHTQQVQAPKATNREDQPDTLTAHGQVLSRARVITMNLMRDLLARRTGCDWSDGSGRNDQGHLAPGDLLDLKPREHERKRTQEEVLYRKRWLQAKTVLFFLRKRVASFRTAARQMRMSQNT